MTEGQFRNYCAFLTQRGCAYVWETKDGVPFICYFPESDPHGRKLIHWTAHRADTILEEILLFEEHIGHAYSREMGLEILLDRYPPAVRQLPLEH